MARKRDPLAGAVKYASLPDTDASSRYRPWAFRARNEPRARIEAAYKDAMGRPFDAGEPRPEDYGSPARPHEDYDRDASPWEAYFAAHDAWRQSPDYATYEAARERWNVRRDQFLYSTRARNRQDVLEGARA